MIRYQVVPLSPQAHVFQVTMRLPEGNPKGQSFYLPAWIRGSYMIRDFARHVISIEASVDGIELPIVKLDKQTWHVEPCEGNVVLTYSVYAWDLSVRAAHLDTTHAYFNGPCLFLAAKGREQEECECHIAAPESEVTTHWRLATGMPVHDVDANGFGIYRLPDYESLLDYPVEMGDLDTYSFTVLDKLHRFVVNGYHKAGFSKLCSDLAKICSKHVEMFGELPIDDYLFMLWVVGNGYGGLEHRNSTSLMCSRDDLPSAGKTAMNEGYRRLLGLCSHEYFHLWNVKRIMPAAFQSAATEQEVYTRQLWVFEGITSYYDELALIRSGVIDKKNYFELLAETITRVMRGSGRLKQTLEESSFDAWTKFYKQDENAPNAIVSYYAKGALFALALDLHIRLQTTGTKSLDDIMRQMWQQFGKQGIGVPERGFEQVAEEVTGLNLKVFFDLGVRSTQDLPLADLLQQFGVAMQLLPAQSASDKGRVLEQLPEPEPAKSVLGAKVATTNNEITLIQVFDHGAAQDAGLSAGDVIVAVDGLRLNENQLEQHIASTAQKNSVKIHVFRRDELMVFDLTPKPAPTDTCVLYLAESVVELQRRRLNAWLQADENQG